MNKLNYFLLGAAGLALASCSQEEVVSTPSGDGVAITVKLPAGYGTRAESQAAQFGTGVASHELSYAVYDGSTGNLVTEGVGEFPSEGSTQEQLTATVYLNLAKGKNYNIAFFAQSKASQDPSYQPDVFGAPNEDDPVYTFDAEAKTVTVNYKGMTSAGNLADAYDCFYACYETGAIPVTGLTGEVTLYRPVAQINWGSSDLTSGNPAAHEKAYGENGQYILSSLSTTAYNTLNLLTGAVSGEQEIQIGAVGYDKGFQSPWQYAFPLGQTEQTIPDNNYAYIAMQYVLAPIKYQDTYDLTLTVTNKANENVQASSQTSVVVANVPVQANYQTNIYGALLTDNANFEVTINPDWITPAYEVSVWDGVSSTTPEIDTDTHTATINQASDLAGLADIINGTTTVEGVPADFEGYTITLEEDVDFGGKPFSGIGEVTVVRNSDNTFTVSGGVFKGTFDGNGKTISNVAITGSSDSDEAAAFLGNLAGEGAEFKNVTFKNVQITGTNNNRAGIIGVVTGGATVSGVTVESGSISAVQCAGGIVGQVIGAGTVSECNNSADITVSNENAGGICGVAYWPNEGETITIEDCVNNGTITASEGAKQTLGGIVGTSGASITGCKNNGDINGGSATTIGGIVAYQNSCGIVSGNTNNGSIKGGGNIGGIVGWVGGGKYPSTSMIYISDNINNGSVEAPNQASGIMAFNRATCTMSGNTNTGAITATNEGGVATGIVSAGYHATDPVNGGNGYINYRDDNTSTGTLSATYTTEGYFGTVWLESSDAASTIDKTTGANNGGMEDGGEEELD